MPSVDKGVSPQKCNSALSQTRRCNEHLTYRMQPSWSGTQRRQIAPISPTKSTEAKESLAVVCQTARGTKGLGLLLQIERAQHVKFVMRGQSSSCFGQSPQTLCLDFLAVDESPPLCGLE